MMQLPIPIFDDETTYNEVELRTPRPETLADVQRVANKAGGYMSAETLLTGTITELRSAEGATVTDSQRIRSLVRDMPWRSVDHLALQSILLVLDDDAIEGRYECPRCKTVQVTEIEEDPELAEFTPVDRVGQLPVLYFPPDAPRQIVYELEQPISLEAQSTKDQQVEHATITTLMLEYPRLRHCMTAASMFGPSDVLRLQFGVLLNACTQVNGREIDNKWRAEIGSSLYRHISIRDLRAISDQVNRYGLDARVEKRCEECDRVWKAPVDTSSFFASALESK